MAKLYNYKHCIVCGRENPIGFNIKFEQGDGYVYGRVTPGRNYEGYNDTIHGGILTTLLDEVMVKALFMVDVISVTMEIKVRFRQPVHTGRPLIVKGYPGDIHSKAASARGEILLDDGTIAAEADGKFYILKQDKRQQMLTGLED